MPRVNRNDIVERLSVCSYCMKDAPPEDAMRACCGEVHFEEAYLLINDEVELAQDIEWVSNE